MVKRSSGLTSPQHSERLFSLVVVDLSLALTFFVLHSSNTYLSCIVNMVCRVGRDKSTGKRLFPSSPFLLLFRIYSSIPDPPTIFIFLHFPLPIHLFSNPTLLFPSLLFLPIYPSLPVPDSPVLFPLFLPRLSSLDDSPPSLLPPPPPVPLPLFSISTQA